VRTFKPRLVPVATEVMALWLHSGDGRALRTHALLAMERRTIHSGLSIGREESQRIVSGRSLTTGLLGSLDGHLRGLGVLRPIDSEQANFRLARHPGAIGLLIG